MSVDGGSQIRKSDGHGVINHARSGGEGDGKGALLSLPTPSPLALRRLASGGVRSRSFCTADGEEWTALQTTTKYSHYTSLVFSNLSEPN